jgi:hypothetical protein
LSFAFVRHAREEPVALLRLPDRRRADRLGDEAKGRELPPRCRVAEDDSSFATVPGEPVKRNGVRTLPAPVSPDADDRALLVQVVDYYHQSLERSPEALEYLQARGLTRID